MTSVLDNHEVLCLENNPLSGTSDMPNFVIIKIEAGNNAIHQFYLSNLNDVLQPPIINHPSWFHRCFFVFRFCRIMNFPKEEE